MKLGSMFGNNKSAGAAALTQKLLNDKKQTAVNAPTNPQPFNPIKKPGVFNVKFPEVGRQQPKDYRPILTKEELLEYFERCKETGYCSFDWETAPEKFVHDKYRDRKMVWQGDIYEAEAMMDDKARAKRLDEIEKEHRNYYNNVYLDAPLDPHKGKIVTVSLCASPHESRVVPLDHKIGKVFEPEMSREYARELFMDLLEKHIFRNESVMKIAVNLAFETKFALKYGRYIGMPVADPLMMWVRVRQLCQQDKIKDRSYPASGNGLKPVTEDIFKVKMAEFKTVLEQAGAEFFDEIDASQGAGLSYSAEDADYGLQHYLYWIQIAKQLPGDQEPNHPGYDHWLLNVEMPFQRVLAQMEYWGIKYDTELAYLSKERVTPTRDKSIQDIKRIAKDVTGRDINLGKSGKTGDVTKFLFEDMKLPVASRTPKGAVSMDATALMDIIFLLERHIDTLDDEQYLDVPLPDDYEEWVANSEEPYLITKLSKAQRRWLEIRENPPHPYKEEGLAILKYLQHVQKLSTVVNTHIDGREKHLNEVTGRIHAGYETWTETSRVNSSKPNGQNLPRPANDELKVRNFYIAGEGKLLGLIDYSGFELRILAYKSGDEVMIDLFVNNGDMHKRTAMTLTGKPAEEITKEDRSESKSGNFGITYGGTEHALQKTFRKLGIRKSLNECAAIVQAVNKTYPRIKEFAEQQTAYAREHGFVCTELGYIRMLPGANSPSRAERNSAGRQATNTPIQGTAADLMKHTQNQVYDLTAAETWEYREAMANNQPYDLIGKFVHGHADQIAQIHDEIMMELDENAEHVRIIMTRIKEIMENPPVKNLPIPIIADPSVASRWGEKKDLEQWLKDYEVWEA